MTQEESFPVCADADIDALFDGFKQEAFRFETLPSYDVAEDEADYAKFVAGDHTPKECPPAMREWCDGLEKARELGKAYRRIRVVTKIPSDYLRFEVSWGFKFSVPCGEEIRFIDEAVVQKSRPPEVADWDFWLFDEAVCALFVYDPEGRFKEARLVPSDLIPHYVNFKRALWHQAHDIQNTELWRI